MKITVELELSPDEVAAATEIISALSKLTEKISTKVVSSAASHHPPHSSPHSAAVSISSSPSPYNASSSLILPHSAAVAAPPSVSVRIQEVFQNIQSSSCSPELLAHDLSTIASLGQDSIIKIADCYVSTIIASIDSAERIGAVLSQLNQTYLEGIRDQILEQLLLVLSDRNRSDREELLPFAHAFAILLKYDIIDASTACKITVSALQEQETATAGYTMIGKLVELSADSLEQKLDSAELSELHQAAFSNKDPAFSYDCSYVRDNFFTRPRVAAALHSSFSLSSSVISSPAHSHSSLMHGPPPPQPPSTFPSSTPSAYSSLYSDGGYPQGPPHPYAQQPAGPSSASNGPSYGGSSSKVGYFASMERQKQQQMAHSPAPSSASSSSAFHPVAQHPPPQQQQQQQQYYQRDLLSDMAFLHPALPVKFFEPRPEYPMSPLFSFSAPYNQQKAFVSSLALSELKNILFVGCRDGNEGCIFAIDQKNKFSVRSSASLTGKYPISLDYNARHNLLMAATYGTGQPAFPPGICFYAYDESSGSLSLRKEVVRKSLSLITGARTLGNSSYFVTAEMTNDSSHLCVYDLASDPRNLSGVYEPPVETYAFQAGDSISALAVLAGSDTAIVAGGQRGTLSLYDRRLPREASWSQRRSKSAIVSLSSHDWSILSASGNQVSLWDVRTQSKLQTIEFDQDVLQARFGYDERTAIVCTPHSIYFVDPARPPVVPVASFAEKSLFGDVIFNKAQRTFIVGGNENTILGYCLN